MQNLTSFSAARSNTIKQNILNFNFSCFNNIFFHLSGVSFLFLALIGDCDIFASTCSAIVLVF